MAKIEFPKSAKLPGSMRLVQYFYDHNIPMAICTGSNKQEFALKTRNHQDMLKMIPVRVSFPF